RDPGDASPDRDRHVTVRVACARIASAARRARAGRARCDAPPGRRSRRRNRRSARRAREGDERHAARHPRTDLASPGRGAIAPVRSFVAVLLDGATRAALGAETERLRAVARDVGWVAPENLHITLKFLGGVDADRLETVGSSLRVAAEGATAFDLVIEGLG